MTNKLVASLSISVLAAMGQLVPPTSSIHYIQPGENPQTILDDAAPGDKLAFLPGQHEHSLRKHQSLLYVDKPIDIELMEGAVLKLADNHTTLELEPELTIDHGAVKTLNDFSAGGRYDGGLGSVIFTIKIDGEGGDGRPDSFSWVSGWGPGSTRGAFQANVPITGDWQPLSHGVEIKFDSRNGHSLGSFWALSYDGRESYGIRVGHGTQPDYNESVRHNRIERFTQTLAGAGLWSGGGS